MPTPAKPKRPLTAAQKLAIARKQAQTKLVGDLLDVLFTNGQEQKAVQLRMHDTEDRFIGGWSRAGAGWQIREVLKRHRLP